MKCTTDIDSLTPHQAATSNIAAMLAIADCRERDDLCPPLFLYAGIPAASAPSPVLMTSLNCGVPCAMALSDVGPASKAMNFLGVRCVRKPSSTVEDDDTTTHSAPVHKNTMLAPASSDSNSNDDHAAVSVAQTGAKGDRAQEDTHSKPSGLCSANQVFGTLGDNIGEDVQHATSQGAACVPVTEDPALAAAATGAAMGASDVAVAVRKSMKPMVLGTLRPGARSFTSRLLNAARPLSSVPLPMPKIAQGEVVLKLGRHNQHKCKSAAAKGKAKGGSELVQQPFRTSSLRSAPAAAVAAAGAAFRAAVGAVPAAVAAAAGGVSESASPPALPLRGDKHQTLACRALALTTGTSAENPRALLLEKLRAWRVARARSIRKGPAAVLPDCALQDIATQQPLTLLELSATVGVGVQKMTTHGHGILEVVRSHVHAMRMQRHAHAAANAGADAGAAGMVSGGTAASTGAGDGALASLSAPAQPQPEPLPQLHNAPTSKVGAYKPRVRPLGVPLPGMRALPPPPPPVPSLRLPTAPPPARKRHVQKGGKAKGRGEHTPTDVTGEVVGRETGLSSEVAMASLTHAAAVLLPAGSNASATASADGGVGDAPKCMGPSQMQQQLQKPQLAGSASSTPACSFTVGAPSLQLPGATPTSPTSSGPPQGSSATGSSDRDGVETRACSAAMMVEGGAVPGAPVHQAHNMAALPEPTAVEDVGSAAASGEEGGWGSNACDSDEGTFDIDAFMSPAAEVESNNGDTLLPAGFVRVVVEEVDAQQPGAGAGRRRGGSRKRGGENNSGKGARRRKAGTSQGVQAAAQQRPQHRSRVVRRVAHVLACMEREEMERAAQVEPAAQHTPSVVIHAADGGGGLGAGAGAVAQVGRKRCMTQPAQGEGGAINAIDSGTSEGFDEDAFFAPPAGAPRCQGGVEHHAPRTAAAGTAATTAVTGASGSKLRKTGPHTSSLCQLTNAVAQHGASGGAGKGREGQTRAQHPWGLDVCEEHVLVTRFGCRGLKSARGRAEGGGTGPPASSDGGEGGAAAGADAAYADQAEAEGGGVGDSEGVVNVRKGATACASDNAELQEADTSPPDFLQASDHHLPSSPSDLPTAPAPEPAIHFPVNVSRRSRRVARGVGLEHPLLRERTKYSVHEDLWILQQAMACSDLPATAATLRRSPAAVRRRLRTLLTSSSRVPAAFTSASAGGVAGAFAFGCSGGNLNIGLRAELINAINGLPGPSAEQVAAAKAERKARIDEAAGGEAVRRGRQGRGRKRTASDLLDEAAAALAADLEGQGPAGGTKRTQFVALDVSLSATRVRTGAQLALAQPPPDLSACSRGALNSFLLEAGCSAVDVQDAVNASCSAAPAPAHRSPGCGRDKGRRGALLRLAQGAVPWWEVARVLACNTLPPGLFKHMAVLRCAQATTAAATRPSGSKAEQQAPPTLTEEAVRASYRKLCLMLHPDKHHQAVQGAVRRGSDGGGGGTRPSSEAAGEEAAAMPAPPSSMQGRATTAFHVLREAKDALLAHLASRNLK